MTLYRISPKYVNPARINSFLGTTKVARMTGTIPYPSVIEIETSSPFTQVELDALRAQLDKAFPFGYTEEVV